MYEQLIIDYLYWKKKLFSHAKAQNFIQSTLNVERDIAGTITNQTIIYIRMKAKKYFTRKYK